VFSQDTTSELLPLVLPHSAPPSCFAFPIFLLPPPPPPFSYKNLFVQQVTPLPGLYHTGLPRCIRKFQIYAKKPHLLYDFFPLSCSPTKSFTVPLPPAVLALLIIFPPFFPLFSPFPQVFQSYFNAPSIPTPPLPLFPPDPPPFFSSCFP